MSAITQAPASAELPPDQAARERILSDLDTNMLVEAGAGSGKTTSLVGRMHALVIRGEPIESIAAVTFTRKSAQELRERFQLVLENELRNGDPASERWQRCEHALRNLDRAFLGTIHSFCSRILREHPLEAALDPSFAELSEDDWEQLTRTFWSSWLERAKRRGDTALSELDALGINPQLLYDGFKTVMKYQDVDFPLVETTAPDGASCRARLEALMARARSIMPKDESPEGGDKLMALVATLEYQQRSSDWKSIAAFCSALEGITRTNCGVTQKCWSSPPDPQKRAKALGEDFIDLLDNDISSLLTCWREHRYPAVMRILNHAAADFGRERHASGRLGFEDLLMLSSRLLREQPRVRGALGVRYRRLLVDEFQDTDPIQAEVCFLLASEPSQGNDWRTVEPRDGAIFLVGDPKQSIYRFRRADIQVYEFAKARMKACGTVLSLTSNFRSVVPIAEFVNEYFSNVFPAAGSGVQAPFSPMEAATASAPADGVGHYWVRPEKANNGAIVRLDAAQIASWIAQRVCSGDYAPGDFLILTRGRDPLLAYAQALGARNIAVSTSGAKLPQELELNELLVILRAIADPDNPVQVAAALEGLFFGCSPADLYDARTAGMEFCITEHPVEGPSIVGNALQQLHSWWKLSQRHAADVLVTHVLDDTGMLCYTASQLLGDARAGALLRIVEVLRDSSMSGAAGIAEAIVRVERLLAADSDDAPLRPGRTDAVRVMNLHKAKGLEARVVILASPTPQSEHLPRVHVARSATGVSAGGVVVAAGDVIIAQPPGWAQLAAIEEGFAAAEEQRLLYVAVTRAMKELLVARCVAPKPRTATEPKPDRSFCAPLAGVLDALNHEIEMSESPTPIRQTVDELPEHVMRRIAAAREAVGRASLASTAHTTVTTPAKDEHEAARVYGLPIDMNSGKAWGRAVHRCIEAAGRGRDGASLSGFVAAVAADEGLRADQCNEIERVVEEIRKSDLWKTIMSGESAGFELPLMQAKQVGERTMITEGVIDAVALNDGEWLLADWKTDTGDIDTPDGRGRQYEKQVTAYKQMLVELSGHTARSVVQRVRTDANHMHSAEY